MKAGKLKIKGQINGAAVYLAKIGSSSTVRNPLFSVQKLIEQINATFLFVKKQQQQQQQQQQTNKNKQNDRNVIERCEPSCPPKKANKKI